jgi:sortase A
MTGVTMNRQQYISAEEIQQLFHQPTKKKQPLSWQLVSAVFLIVLGVFIFINAPSIAVQLGYWWDADIKTGQQTAQQTTGPVNGQLPVIPDATPTPVAIAQLDPNQLPDNTIYIPRIKTKAPVIWDVSAGGNLNDDLLKALQKGVARYPKTALPDQVGNVFLTGHSSNYWWDPGHYKTIFALLNRLVVGDTIYIKYQGTLYTYKVNGQKVVKPTETSVLNPTSKPTLSLMTCTPTGTSLYRRIVTADLVGPTANLKSQPTQPTDATLSDIR